MAENPPWLNRLREYAHADELLLREDPLLDERQHQTFDDHHGGFGVGQMPRLLIRSRAPEIRSSAHLDGLPGSAVSPAYAGLLRSQVSNETPRAGGAPAGAMQIGSISWPVRVHSCPRSLRRSGRWN